MISSMKRKQYNYTLHILYIIILFSFHNNLYKRINIIYIYIYNNLFQIYLKFISIHHSFKIIAVAFKKLNQYEQIFFKQELKCIMRYHAHHLYKIIYINKYHKQHVVQP